MTGRTNREKKSQTMQLDIDIAKARARRNVYKQFISKRNTNEEVSDPTDQVQKITANICHPNGYHSAVEIVICMRDANH
jgi:hypothetical protein